MPLPSSTSRLGDEVLVGTSGLSWMPVRNDDVSAEMSTAPASAVPTDAPRLVTVFWRPPTSPLCSSGTDDTVTRAELRRQRADAEPGEQHRPRDDLGPGAGVERGDQHDEPGEQREEAERTTRRGEACGKSLGMPTAASSSVTESGSSRTPVAIGRQPERHRQEQRHHEEEAGLQEVLEEERGEPAAERRVPQHRRIDRAPPRRASSRRVLPRAGTAAARRRRRAPARSPATARATPARRAWAGRSPTCRTRRMPNTTRPRPSADSAVPTRSSPAPGSGRRVGHAAGEQQDHEHDEHLAGEHQPPRQVGGEEPADERPGGDRDRAGRRRRGRTRAAARRARSSTRPAPRSPA